MEHCTNLISFLYPVSWTASYQNNGATRHGPKPALASQSWFLGGQGFGFGFLDFWEPGFGFGFMVFKSFGSVVYRSFDLFVYKTSSISPIHHKAKKTKGMGWRGSTRCLRSKSCQLWYKSLMEHYRFDFAHGALLPSLQLQWLQSIHQRHKPLSTLSCTSFYKETVTYITYIQCPSQPISAQFVSNGIFCILNSCQHFMLWLP